MIKQGYLVLHVPLSLNYAMDHRTPMNNGFKKTQYRLIHCSMLYYKVESFFFFDCKVERFNVTLGITN